MKIIGKALEKAVLKKAEKEYSLRSIFRAGFQLFNLRSIKNKSVEV